MLQQIALCIGLLWLIFACGLTEALCELSTPLSRQQYVEILEKINTDTIATDVLGAWTDAYGFIFPMRYVDETFYERMHHRLGEDCGKTYGERVVCSMRNAATIAEDNSLATEASVIWGDAARYAEKFGIAESEENILGLVQMAYAAWTLGSATEAEKVISRAEELSARKNTPLKETTLLRLAVMKARLSEAKLDDGTAVRSFREARELLNAIRGLTDEENYRDPVKLARNDFESLMKSYAAGRFCRPCGAALLNEFHAELIERLKSPESDKLSTVSLMLLSPPKAFSEQQLETAAVALVSTDRDKALARRLKGKTTVQIGRALAMAKTLSQPLEDGSPEEALAMEQKIISFIAQPSPKSRRALAKALASPIIAQMRDSMYYSNGVFRGLAEMNEIAFLSGEDAVFRQLFELWDKQSAEYEDDGEGFRSVSSQDAYEFVTGLVRYVSSQIERPGDIKRDALEQLLARASAIADAKSRDEWSIGGPSAILMIRRLATVYESIARSRHKLATGGRRDIVKDFPRADAMFLDMQKAVLGEVALVLELAAQRRLAGSPNSFGALQAISAKSLTVRQLEDLIQRYTDYGALRQNLDIDGALTRVVSEEKLALAELTRSQQPQVATRINDLSPVSLSEVRKRLRRREALIMINAKGSQLDALLIDASSTTKIWSSSIDEERLTRLVGDLHNGGDIRGYIPQFPADTAYELFSNLFGPAKSVLLANYDSLIIVGNGPLQSIPFGALLRNRPTNREPAAREFRAAKLEWLSRTHSIYTLPSVGSLIALRGLKPSAATNSFIGIGNPVLGPPKIDSPRNVEPKEVFKGGAFADVEFLRKLPSLPDTEVELTGLAAMFGRGSPARTMLGRDATEEAVKSTGLDAFKIVAFATHGALAGEIFSIEEPGLILTPPSQATALDDGFLGLAEISSLRLDADLVILSACNTGKSDGRPRAEALSGLARAFMQTGARSLLVTHWSIPSRASALLMTRMVDIKSKKQEIDWAQALRLASIEFMDGKSDKEIPVEWAHPSFWAGFSLIGVAPLQSSPAQPSR